MLADGQNIIAKKRIVDHCCNYNAEDFKHFARYIKVQDLCVCVDNIHYLLGNVSLWFLVYLLCTVKFKYCFSMSTQT